MNILFFVSHWLVKNTLNIVSSQLLRLRNRHLFVVDVFIFLITPLLALLLRLDGHLDIKLYAESLAVATGLFLVIKIVVFWSFGFYRRYWRYASIEELVYVGVITTASVVIQVLLFDSIKLVLPVTLSGIPKSLPFIDGLLTCVFIGALRFSFRVTERLQQRRASFDLEERVIVVGAGNAGVSLVQEMQRNPHLGLRPVAFIDDDPQKLNTRIRGVPVVGTRTAIPDAARNLYAWKAIIAMPSVSGQVIRNVVDICKSAQIQTSTVPGLDEILNGRVRVESIRDVRIEDLLRREPVQTETERVYKFIRGKKVLITGAGGSIGSELCRQILKCRPSEIILVGHGENSVFNIQQELEQLIQVLKEEGQALRQKPRLSTFIADIRFRDRLQHAFERHQPDVIFHAAAHKHVPLMEVNPAEAITNNVVGTKNLVELALKYNVNHFVMISTDKAVNPTNVMGASKRVAEMLVLQAAKQSGKSYVAVRFGNVLGSRGSVVPTFKKQIAAGGPITVTHPDICRYFMTIPEAVQLVLQAAVLGRGGEVLMLNMGQPVKIVDLAEELIRLSGYEVNKDIDIVFTGLRPGEKLFEELFIEGEEYDPTEHEKLFMVRNASQIIPDNLNVAVNALCQAATKNDANSIMFLLEQVAPGYKPRYTQNQVSVDASKNTYVIEKSVDKIFTRIEPKRT
ncbi:polysaccharide biosynthesis protein CapD [Calothrix sp. NIES-4071]|nr:polysaccharide biosynthesis protein CapD [Calothrix sp. NIES-4071]BAZ58960.1 polysaccharide biosynthesis protein CapD [Calothrix sp. NIES-4105]